MVEVLEMDTTVDAAARRQGPEGFSAPRSGIPCGPLFEDSPPPARGPDLGVDIGANQGGVEGFDSICHRGNPSHH